MTPPQHEQPQSFSSFDQDEDDTLYRTRNAAVATRFQNGKPQHHGNLLVTVRSILFRPLMMIVNRTASSILNFAKRRHPSAPIIAHEETPDRALDLLDSIEADTSVAELETLHDLFCPRFRHYSPLQGKFFICSRLVHDLYQFPTRGRRHEPAIDLVHSLFEMKLGGAIQLISQSHAKRGRHNVGAHLTPCMIGGFFETLERLRTILTPSIHTPSTAAAIQQKLAKALYHDIGNHDTYRIVIQELKDQRDKTRKALTESQRQKQDEALAPRQGAGSVLVSDLRQQCNRMSLGQELRSVEAAVRNERASRKEFAKTLARCLLVYELGFRNDRNSNLPKFSTTAILLSYMWHKYNQRIEAFEGYVQAMSRLGALNCSLEEALSTLRPNTQSTAPDSMTQLEEESHSGDPRTPEISEKCFVRRVSTPFYSSTSLEIESDYNVSPHADNGALGKLLVR